MLDPGTGRGSALARRFAVLVAVLVLLYYVVASQVTMQNLTSSLHDAADRATEQQADLQAQITDLREQLDDATAQVAMLREQLISAGITPSLPTAPGTDPGQ